MSLTTLPDAKALATAHAARMAESLTSAAEALADVPERFGEPWSYWRTVTILLATLWFTAALVRLLFFHRRWERRLEEFGASRRCLRRQLLGVVLRVTVLDPINLALLLLIAALWSAPRVWG